MSRLVFLRHAHSTANESGILSGRLAGVVLSEKGRKQADSLKERIGASKFDQVRISPLERCHQTIKPWLSSHYGSGIGQFIIDDGLNEVDYGSWSGRKLSSLQREPMWKLIQSKPSSVLFPNGERISKAQSRVVDSVLSAHTSKKNGVHLFISHGDVIKAALAHLLGLPLNRFQNLVIDPASISILDFDGESARLLCYNDTHQNIFNYTERKGIAKVLLGGGSGISKRRRR